LGDAEKSGDAVRRRARRMAVGRAGMGWLR